MKMNTIRISVFLTLVIVAFITSAEETVVNKDKSGLVLKGYDPVAYFTEGKAVEGKKEFEQNWMNATWRFSSVENQNLFVADPKKYAPQFGGYCAFGVTGGYLAPVDPKAWKVIDNKLYLNYNFEVQKKWEKDIPGNIEKAKKKWPEASKSKPLE